MRLRPRATDRDAATGTSESEWRELAGVLSVSEAGIPPSSEGDKE